MSSFGSDIIPPDSICHDIIRHDIINKKRFAYYLKRCKTRPNEAHRGALACLREQNKRMLKKEKGCWNRRHKVKVPCAGPFYQQRTRVTTSDGLPSIPPTERPLSTPTLTAFRETLSALTGLFNTTCLWWKRKIQRERNSDRRIYPDISTF